MSKYWLTLEQWKDDPEFQRLAENEFLSSPFNEVEKANSSEGGWARREFLKLMGASLALSAAGCIRRPVAKIIPYAKAPAEIIPGVANFYATSWLDNGQAYGLLIRTREGRPIKVEGNPDHPVNAGGTSARAQAHILQLYDPDRLQGPKRNLQNDSKTDRDTIGVSWEDLDRAVGEQLKNGSCVVLTGTLASPSTEALIGEFCKAHSASHVVWDALGAEDMSEGQKLSFGQEVVPRFRLDKARLVVTIDSDLLGTYLSPVENMKQWARGRTIGPEMLRWVAFESMLSLTGMNADERIRIKPSQQLAVAMGLLHEIVVQRGLSSYASDPKAKSVLLPFANVASELGIKQDKFRALAEELWSHRGRSLVVAGGLAGRTQASRQLMVAVNLLNAVLENDGRTIDSRVTQNTWRGSYQAMAKLIADMQAGRVKTLIIHGLNPVYALPANAGFASALKKVEMVLSTSDRIDETSALADYVACDHHPLENWGDLEAQTGVYSVQQPTISPLYNTRSFQDSLLTWTKNQPGTSANLKASKDWHEYLRGHWKANLFSKARSRGDKPADFEDFWVSLLQKGIYDSSEGLREQTSAPRRASVDALRGATPSKQKGYELVLYSTIGLADGSLNNVSWLQEFPDPVTKICWDNYVCVSPQTAQKEGLSQGLRVKLRVEDQELNLPVHIQPGLHDEVLAVAVGYGREQVGKVGSGIGVNAFNLVNFKQGAPVFSGLSVELKKTKEKYQLAAVAGHHSMEGRQIIVESSLAEILKDPNAGIERERVFSIWPAHKYPGHKWAMTIDLNTCTGCSACMTACQAENNIPVVGKRLVLDGREMFWIRLDRYHEGSPENPNTLVQPMLCQHCANAPCESVCPVLATVHSDEGTNDMIYNRCVGTRYCSNNCPYKVRRFNWFNYTKSLTEPANMVLNPDVTVRTRGVMEKCTFCVQRIQEAKNDARNKNEALKDGDVKTACQSACPTQAIVFGDINDQTSRVAKMWAEPRGYGVLEEWNTQPSVRYLARVRNALTPAKPGHPKHHEKKHEESV